MDTGWVLERILQHKRMVTSLEHWNDQVTEYRRWCLQQQERAEGGVITVTRTKKSRTMDQNNNTSNDINENALIAADHSVFVMLGGDDGTEDTAAAAHDNYYGPASDGMEPLKKNRKGQRARRAKAQAVEARKTGRVFQPEESLNWRRSKSQPQQQQQQQRQPSRQHQEAVVSVKPNEDLHPSWQARKEKKDGIVAFQGKKITFD